MVFVDHHILNKKRLALLIANKTSEKITSMPNLIKKLEHEKGQEKKASKRQLAWDWKKGVPVPEKKCKIVPMKVGKSQEKYVCTECLKPPFLGKRDEKFASLYRSDTSSIKQHKERWHKEAESTKCTVVPSNAPEGQSLRKQYDGSKALTITSASKQEKTDSTFSIEIMASSEEDVVLLTQKKVCDNNSEAIQPTTLTPKGKNQSTLLAFKEAIEATVPAPDDASIKDVICDIDKLSLKFDQFGSPYNTLQQLVFEDDNIPANTLTIREAKNIYELTDGSEFIEFFYDEDSETSILRCLPCFKYHIMAKPTIRRLNPFEAQQLICSSSNDNVCTGLFLNKSTTR